MAHGGIGEVGTGAFDARRLGAGARLRFALASLALAALASTSLALTGCVEDGPLGQLLDAGVPRDGSTFGDASFPPLDEACFGRDGDEPESDCAPVRCRAVAACCVGSARGECCRADGARTLVGLACSDGLACFEADPSIRAFGGELPTVEAGGLVPQGGLGHGGVALGDELDPRGHNVQLDAVVEVPRERCVDCVDAAGVALLDAVPAPGARAVVAFGVLVSGSRDEVVVLVADEVVARSPLVSGTLAVQLTTDVEGTGRVIVGEQQVARIEGLVLPPRVSLAVFGRTSNRAGVLPVRVSSATASLATCDVPSALARGSAPVLPWSGATWSPVEVRRPSVVGWTEDDGTSRALMAFAHEGEIHLAGRTSFGEFRSAAFDPGPPAFERPEELAAARDPWLLIHERRFILFFVGVDVDGHASIWRTTGGPLLAQTFGRPAPILDPTSLGFDQLEGPTVLVADGLFRMMARVVEGSASSAVLSSIVELHSRDQGASWHLQGTVALPRPDDVFAFDRDDVAAPALVVVPDANGSPTVRVYYGGRRGTRWSIGLYVEGGGAWRRMGEVLGPTPQAFDAFGVTDPAPLVEDGVLRLYYAGTDGARWRFGLAGPRGTPGE